MEKAKTKRMIITEMLGEDFVQANEDYKRYLENELSILDKKNANRSGKSNEEDIEITNLIVETLETMTTEDKKMFTITEILSNENLRDYTYGKDNKVLSNSKITSLLLKETKNENARVVNKKDKKNSLYGLV